MEVGTTEHPGLKPSRDNWGDSSVSTGWKRFWLICTLGEGLKLYFCSTISLIGTMCGCCTCPTVCTLGFGTTGIVSAILMWVFGFLLMVGTFITCIIPVLIPFIGWIFLAVAILIFTFGALLFCFGLSCLVFVPFLGLFIGCVISSTCPLTGCGFMIIPNPALLLLIKLFLRDVEDDGLVDGSIPRKGLPSNPIKIKSSEDEDEEDSDIENSDPSEIFMEDGLPVSERPIEYTQEKSQQKNDDNDKFELDTLYLNMISSNTVESPSSSKTSEIDVPYQDHDSSLENLSDRSLHPHQIHIRTSSQGDPKNEDNFMRTTSIPPPIGQSILEGDLKDIDIVTIENVIVNNDNISGYNENEDLQSPENVIDDTNITNEDDNQEIYSQQKSDKRLEISSILRNQENEENGELVVDHKTVNDDDDTII